MNETSLSKSRVRTSAALAVMVGAAYALSIAMVSGAEKAPAKKLAGADLYAINCSRCHPERYPTEWTPAQWKTLMLHMRVRANLPAAQAKLILKYLQEDSGN